MSEDKDNTLPPQWSITPSGLVRQIYSLYPQDSDGNVTGAPNEFGMMALTARLEAWTAQFANTRDAYGELPADNSNNITGFLRAQAMLEETQELLGQAHAFNAMNEAARQMGTQRPETEEAYQQFREQYNARSENMPASAEGATFKPVTLPETLPRAPAASAITSIQYDLNESRLPPKVEVPAKSVDRVADAAAPDKPTVKEVMESNNHFATALRELNNGDKQAAGASIEKGLKELAGNAFDAAGGKSADKERFVDVFVKDYIDAYSSEKRGHLGSLLGMPKEAAEARIADLMILKDNPQVIIDGLNQTLYPKKSQPEKTVASSNESLEQEYGRLKKEYLAASHILAEKEGKKFNYGEEGQKFEEKFSRNPNGGGVATEYHAENNLRIQQELDEVRERTRPQVSNDEQIKGAASQLTSNMVKMGAVRNKVESLAYNSDKNYHGSRDAGGAAISEVIGGKDRDTVIAQNAEKFPKKEDNSPENRLNKAAEQYAIAGIMFDQHARGLLVNKALIDDEKHASREQIDNYGLGPHVGSSAADFKKQLMLEDPKTLRMNEEQLATYAEDLARKHTEKAMMYQVDTDRDGKLSNKEVAIAAKALVDRDRNGVDEKEMLAFEKAANDKNNPLAMALAKSGLDIEQVKLAMQGKIAGGENVAVARDLTGALGEGQAAPIVATTKTPSTNQSFNMGA